MASISKDKLRSGISDILKDADLSQLSAKKVRRQLEEKFGVELTERKKEIDELVMAGVDEIQKKQDASENEDEDEDSESDFSAPEDCGPPKKKAKTSKGSDAKLAQQLQDEEDTGVRRTRHGSTPKSKKKLDKKKKKKSAMVKTSILSDDLAELMGEKEMPKTDVVKKMWQIIKERDLKDPANKQFIICDEQLLKIFGEERIRPFGMMKYLKDHMTPGGERPRKVEEGESDDENGAGSGSDDEEQAKKTKRKSGYQKPLLLSPALAALMGESEMPRSDVVKKMWAIIKERNLADPKNRQFMLCDAELLTIFGQKRVRTFGMMKFLKNHMYTKEDLVDS